MPLETRAACRLTPFDGIYLLLLLRLASMTSPECYPHYFPHLMATAQYPVIGRYHTSLNFLY